MTSKFRIVVSKYSKEYDIEREGEGDCTGHTDKKKGEMKEGDIAGKK